PRVLQVDGDAPLAPVDGKEVRGLAVGRARRGPLPAVVPAPRVLDLDHLGAVVAQDLRSERARHDAREIEHTNAGQQSGPARHYTRPTIGLQTAGPRRWRSRCTLHPRPRILRATSHVEPTRRRPSPPHRL